MSHDMRQHASLDDVIKKVVGWEDADSWLVVSATEDGKITVCSYWEGGPDETKAADTLLEALYRHFPKCYCDEDSIDDNE